MKVAFSKISNTNIPFEVINDGIKFEGQLKRKSEKLILVNAKMIGVLSHICDSCGTDLPLDINESIELVVSEGIYKDTDNQLSDVIEFFDPYLDLNEVLESEIEAYKSDYFYCENCKDK